jgi:Domain of unknown function (DUF222)
MTSNDVLARDQVLAELAALGPGSGDALALLTQVRQAAVFADQVMGELARLAGVVDRTGAFAAAGYSCAAAFFRHGCGRSVGRSGELVAVGRALPRLTATGQALALGLVSFDAAHVICRAVAQISDDDLAAAAEQEMLGAATIGLPGSRSAAEALAGPPLLRPAIRPARVQRRTRPRMAIRPRPPPASLRVKPLPRYNLMAGRPRAWTPVSCVVWVRTWPTGPIRTRWRSASAHGSSAAT